MNPFLVYVVSITTGILFGSLSARMLMRQTALAVIKPGLYFVVSSLLRLGAISLVGWFLLHWGTLPLILFGGSLLVAKWLVIAAYN